MKEKKNTASIQNELAIYGHYGLSAIEQKLVLYLITRLKPKEEKAFNTISIPMREIEKYLKGDIGKWGSVYSYLRKIRKKLLRKQLEFTSPVTIQTDEGEKHIVEGEINWFSSILIVKDNNNVNHLEFRFSDEMKPFLLKLSEYVRLNIVGIAEMKGKYAIRMYQAFKAERERIRNTGRNKAEIIYEIDELKAMLGVIDKYSMISNFRRRVIEPMINEINRESLDISISYHFIRKGREIHKIAFEIYDKQNIELPRSGKKEAGNYEPNQEDLDKLTFAQSKAYQILLDFGVYGGIAYKQILPTIKGASMEGYEDLFVEQAIRLFKRKEKGKLGDKKSTGAFVNWWTKKKVFDISGDVFFQISDKVHATKKQLSQERLDNRAVAKGMTKGAFEEWYEENQALEKDGA